MTKIKISNLKRFIHLRRVFFCFKNLDLFDWQTAQFDFSLNTLFAIFTSCGLKLWIQSLHPKQYVAPVFIGFIFDFVFFMFYIGGKNFYASHSMRSNFLINCHFKYFNSSFSYFNYFISSSISLIFLFDSSCSFIFLFDSFFFVFLFFYFFVRSFFCLFVFCFVSLFFNFFVFFFNLFIS